MDEVGYRVYFEARMGLLRKHPERVQIRCIFEGSGGSDENSEKVSDHSLSSKIVVLNGLPTWDELNIGHRSSE